MSCTCLASLIRPVSPTSSRAPPGESLPSADVAALQPRDMLDRLEAGGWPLDLVDEVLVFGSYARGALNPADVDVVVEHRTDERLTSEFVNALSYGRDPSASMKRALKGTSRGLQIHFRERKTLEAEGFELTPLWTRGEPLAAARTRLTAITPDPTAGRAPRDHMLDAFEGIDRWVPRPVRVAVKCHWSATRKPSFTCHL
ncbi:nucleotidyltransferase domain-containing protein [Streptomyces violens]|uniref:nucleotidyltransferase domain-containing protein n=1 Tax=Streptomyces violens TaxID=66377 RepID=UPI00068D4D91|nr:nucleotidyltransferase domain-containing protein [Streptomyces violens]